MNAEAAQLIRRFGMIPLPGEGGFFVQTWISAARIDGGRPLGSAILFLITDRDFSALHRLQTDEIWHYHAGDPAELIVLDPDSGVLSVTILGPDAAGVHRPQVVVPAGSWQGARLEPSSAVRGWTLFGCTMSPGWVEAEFELGRRDELERRFPSHAATVRALTR
jgi:predicted cupin superfamily sugar epimerase